MEVVTRAQWGAAAPKARSTFSRAPEGVFLHYTSSDYDRAQSHSDCAKRVKGIQSFHQGPSRGWSDIGYSFLYCMHGVVFEGRGWQVSGAHTVGYNSTAHAFCFLGGDRDGRDDLTDKGRAAAAWLIREAFKRHPEGKRVRGHGDVNPTACPGKEIFAFIHVRGWEDLSPGADESTVNFKGYWQWLAWLLGEGDWAGKGPKDPKTRPNVPKKIPKEWWARAEKFIAARRK